jgi:anhydro-N-acetylmuramic acid kinase
VVADFRQADVAAGGEGAPLTPAFDYLLFRKAKRDTVCLNLGGIANISGVRAGGRPSDVLGFDVGPCNLLLDGLSRLLLKRRCDRGGLVAAQGHPREDVVREFLRDPFYRRRPPKSTGREHFGERFVKEFARGAGRGKSQTPDVLATACLFVARSIARACDDFVLPEFSPDRVVVSGGGHHNAALRGLLHGELGKLRLRAELFGEAGLKPDSKEAGLFAWLASEFVCGQKAHLPQVTGAREARVLGVFHP